VTGGAAKRCEGCGETFTRRSYPGGSVETWPRFRTRRFCSARCTRANQHLWQKSGTSNGQSATSLRRRAPKLAWQPPALRRDVSEDDVRRSLAEALELHPLLLDLLTHPDRPSPEWEVDHAMHQIVG
jgi:hypothetical protein